MDKKEKPKDDVILWQLLNSGRNIISYVNAGLPLNKLDTLTDGLLIGNGQAGWKDFKDTLLMWEDHFYGNYIYNDLPDKAKACDRREGLLKFHNNQYTNFAIRKRAQEFIDATDCDCMFDWLIMIDCCTATSDIYISDAGMYYLSYFLTCVRNSIRINDFNRRGFSYTPRYVFECPVSVHPDESRYHTKGDDLYCVVWFQPFFADLLMDLLSVFCNKDYKDNEYLVNVLNESDLLNLSVVQCVNKSGGAEGLASLLLWLFEKILTFEAMLKRTETNNSLIDEAKAMYDTEYTRNTLIVACVKLLKLIFKRIVILESFARTF